MAVVIGRRMQQSSLNFGKPGEKLQEGEGFGSSGVLLPTNSPTRQPANSTTHQLTNPFLLTSVMKIGLRPRKAHHQRGIHIIRVVSRQHDTTSV